MLHIRRLQNQMGMLVGAVMAIMLTVVGFELAFGNEGSTQPVLASEAGKIMVAFADTVPGNDPELRQLQVLMQDANGGRRKVGKPERYSALAISPDGQQIAALVTSANETGMDFVYLFDVKSGDRGAVVSLPSDADIVTLSWSPDSSNLAIVGAIIQLVDRGGRIISRSPDPPSTSANSAQQISGGFLWSLDGARFVSTMNGSLIVLSRSGLVTSLQLSDLGITIEESQPAVVTDWIAPEMIVVVVVDGGSMEGFELSLAGSTPIASRLPASADLPHHPNNVPPSAQAIRDVGQLAPGGTMVRRKLTSGGLAEVFEIRQGIGSTNTSSVSLVVREKATGATFKVVGVPSGSRGGQLYDAVVLSSGPER